MSPVSVADPAGSASVTIPLTSYLQSLSIPLPKTLSEAITSLSTIAAAKPDVRRPLMPPAVETILAVNNDNLDVVASTVTCTDLGTEKLFDGATLPLSSLRAIKDNGKSTERPTLVIEGESLALTAGYLYMELVDTTRLIYRLKLVVVDAASFTTLAFKREIRVNPRGYVDPPSTEWLTDLRSSSERLSHLNVFKDIWAAYGPHRQNIDNFAKWAAQADQFLRSRKNLREAEIREIDRRKKENDEFAAKAERLIGMIMSCMRNKIILHGLATATARFLPKDGSTLVDWSWRYDNWKSGMEELDLKRVKWETVISHDAADAPDNNILDASQHKGFISTPGVERRLCTRRSDLAGCKQVCVWVRVNYRHTFDWGEQIFISDHWMRADLQVFDLETITKLVRAFTLSIPPSIRMQGPYMSIDWTKGLPAGTKTENFKPYGAVKWKLELMDFTSRPAKILIWTVPGNLTWNQQINGAFETITEAEVSIYAVIETGLLGDPVITAPTSVQRSKRHAPASTLGSGESLGCGEFLQCIAEGGKFEVRLTLGDSGDLALHHITLLNKRTVYTKDGAGKKEISRMVMQLDGSLIAPHPRWNEHWRIEPDGGKKEAGSTLAIRADGSMAIISPQGKDLWIGGKPALKDPSQPDRIKVGEALWVNQKLVSPNGRFSLILQGDENLVVYDGSNPIWANDRGGRGARYGVDLLVVQEDDNVVSSGPRGVSWSTGTDRRSKGGKGSLILRDDGKVVLESDGTIIWSTDPNLVQPYEPLELDRVPANSDRLRVGQFLGKGDRLISKNRAFALTLQQNGNLVLSRTLNLNAVLWSTKTADGVTRLCFGKKPRRLGLWGSNGHTKWEPVQWDQRRQPEDNAMFVLGDDGDLTFSHEVADPRRPNGRLEIVNLWSLGTKYPAGTAEINSLSRGETLFSDQNLVSPNKQYTVSVTSEGSLRIIHATASPPRTLMTTDPLYKPLNSSEAPSTLRLTTNGILQIHDQTGTERWSQDSSADSFALTDRAEILLLRRDFNVVHAFHPRAMPYLRTGGSLFPNQRILSPDASHELIFQTDGNLVLYQTPGPGRGSSASVRWATSTDNKGSSSLELQTDGNLVMYGVGYSKDRRPVVWALNSVDEARKGLIRQVEVRNDGSLVLVEEGKIVKSLK